MNDDHRPPDVAAGQEDVPPDVVDDGPEAMPMPRWVAPSIGLVLVIMAGLAVYTGLRFRQNSMANGIIHPRSAPARGGDGGGPPGEPEPGASLVFPGDAGDNAPAANAPVAGHARTEISGGGTGGVVSTPRYWVRRGMIINAEPDDAMVYVNDLAVGEVKQYNTADEVYDFAAPGSYTVRIAAPGYREEVFVVTAAESAKEELVTVKAKLAKQ